MRAKALAILAAHGADPASFAEQPDNAVIYQAVFFESAARARAIVPAPILSNPRAYGDQVADLASVQAFAAAYREAQAVVRAEIAEP